MYSAYISKYTLKFKIPAKTSRNTLEDKTLWLLHLSEEGKNTTGIGECSPLKGLSPDDSPAFEEKLNEVVKDINAGAHPRELDLNALPSIRFGLETALLDLENGGVRKIFDTPFYDDAQKIPINGLVWMADRDNMLQQAREKIRNGYSCVKFKIGALDFDDECRMLEELRKEFSAFKVEIRLDANGAFAPDTALEQLRELSRFEIHSIEQPIRQGQWEAMEAVCRQSKIPVALDEELIGISPFTNGDILLKTIQPQYIIIKPGLLGGFEVSREWIRLAESKGKGWWITSALESNIGLNGIAQFASQYRLTLPQGLGTGQLYENNFEGPLTVERGFIYYNPSKHWKNV